MTDKWYNITSESLKFLKKRHAKESRLKLYGIGAIALSFLFLILLLSFVIKNGYSSFVQTKILIPVSFCTNCDKSNINYQSLLTNSIINYLHLDKEDVTRSQKIQINQLFSSASTYELISFAEKNESIATNELWLTPSSNVDMYIKNKTPKDRVSLTPYQVSIIDKLKADSRVELFFNKIFFANADSYRPEKAGVLGSTVGSFFVLIVFFSISFPIAVLTALYLEEFAPSNKFISLIEININNLASIPSIIYGLLGLQIYLNFLHLPRSSSIVAGLTLSFLTLSVIIVTTRNSIKVIPDSIKNAALSLGASDIQIAFGHTLPLALPGIMTGTILAISRAIGETAPLILIGMIAFVADIPHGFFDPATVLPVQIFLWSSNPDMGFTERASAAVMVLLCILIVLNGFASFIRRKFEVKW